MLAIRSLLSHPGVYRTFWNVIGGPGYIKVFVEEYVRPKPGARILDIGCGPGTTVPYFANTEYVGFDISPNYIESARRRFPQATFVCERISHYTLPQDSYFDVVLALGIIHHLDDAEAQQLCETAYRALKPGGKLVTFDGVLTDSQSRLARYLVTRDRGEHVRNEQGYIQIASRVFPNVRSTVRHDLLRIPYTHMIMECVR
jgi:cyclopropane fatty-acyl-phospholipid synthase-like methyltransferase